MEDKDELAFSHGLVRDVAYRQIPRAGRAKRHLAVARWLEDTAGRPVGGSRGAARPPHHRGPDARDRVRAPARGHRRRSRTRRAVLLLAGERQTPIDVAQAAAYYRGRSSSHPTGHPATRRSCCARAPSSRGVPARSTSARRSARTKRRWSRRSRTATSTRPRGACAGSTSSSASGATRRPPAQLLDRGIELLERRRANRPSSWRSSTRARAEDEMFAGRRRDRSEWADRRARAPPLRVAST